MYYLQVIQIYLVLAYVTRPHGIGWMQPDCHSKNKPEKPRKEKSWVK